MVAPEWWRAIARRRATTHPGSLMRYLVTGASGFVGRALTRHLLDAGIQVHALVRDPTQAEAADRTEGTTTLTLADFGIDTSKLGPTASTVEMYLVVEGIRLLREGGAVIVHRAALGGRAGDASANDAEVSAVREAARLIAEDERLTPVLIPLGDGLLAAVRG